MKRPFRIVLSLLAASIVLGGAFTAHATLLSSEPTVDYLCDMDDTPVEATP